MGKRSIPPEPSDVQEIALREALEERYLQYALSTITGRALPDARDGLKPVHRRLLFAMRQLRLDPGAAYKKCARIVGDVIGKYHPHGDQAVYDALVRLAQDFAQRYPLVDGQGNFGNVDGDNPAAMRYTEARLTQVARLLLDGIEEDAIDFRPTYDGTDSEPVVLPGAFPNLLANGSQGIAVGMATSIPPHNAHELCDAALFLIDNPNARAKTLIKRMAELYNEKKLPLVDNFRDESTEDVRIVIEPRSRTVDPGILMESLFKLTELESRIGLNMNVLSKGKVPKVMDLAEVLKEWLDHRREVLI